MIKQVMFVLCVFYLLFLMTNFVMGNKFTCHLSSFGEDKYCREYFPWNDSSIRLYEVRSHEADRVAAQKAEIEKKERIEREAEEKKCYDDGFDFQEGYDIIKDYGLSCSKISYINDHLIDERVNGGYIEGSYSGFFSRGQIEGSFDIMKDSLATGKLVQNISYHVNCRNETVDQKIDYYDESEFVLYYVEKCL